MLQQHATGPRLHTLPPGCVLILLGLWTWGLLRSCSVSGWLETQRELTLPAVGHIRILHLALHFDETAMFTFASSKIRRLISTRAMKRWTPTADLAASAGGEISPDLALFGVDVGYNRVLLILERDVVAGTRPVLELDADSHSRGELGRRHGAGDGAVVAAAQGKAGHAAAQGSQAPLT